MDNDKDLLKDFLAKTFKEDQVETDHLDFDKVYNASTKKVYPFFNAGNLKIAASIIVIFGIGATFYLLNTASQNNQTPALVLEDNIKIDSTDLKKDIAIPKQQEPIQEDDNSAISGSKSANRPQISSSSKDTKQELENRERFEVSNITIKKYASNLYTKFFKLPDESEVILQKNSTLDYHLDQKNHRNVKITGNIFFDVQKDKNKPFKIQGKNSLVTVTGTSFVMSSNKNTDQLTLIEGSVEVKHRNSDKVLKLKPGQSYLSNAQELKLLDRTPNIFAWKTRIFNFKDQEIKSVLKDLENAYDIKVNVEDDNVLNCAYNASFREKNPDQILAIMAATLQLSLEKNGKTYLLKGKSKCL